MKRTLSTVKQFCNRYPAFTEGGLRWEIFNAETNGLAEAGAILRNGRKVLIHEERYFARLDQKNGIDRTAVDSNIEVV